MWEQITLYIEEVLKSFVLVPFPVGIFLNCFWFSATGTAYWHCINPYWHCLYRALASSLATLIVKK